MRGVTSNLIVIYQKPRCLEKSGVKIVTLGNRVKDRLVLGVAHDQVDDEDALVQLFRSLAQRASDELLAIERVGGRLEKDNIAGGLRVDADAHLFPTTHQMVAGLGIETMLDVIVLLGTSTPIHPA